MAKGGKLAKLIKKLSFGKSTATNTISSSFSSSISASSSSIRSDISDSASSDTSSATLHPVYVGKSRRRYLLSSDVVGHPLVQQVAGKTAGDDDITVVGCEVVLFEHLLWMLDNADPMPESLDELADFYAC
ncbi:auxin-responsive protein SAUR76 [Beta vulgaris subsp. vulgaris]|uniref:auxin-responsive protein SAUR76 n=1 Tax=Beta vulgaris subsp. vulgaris TaxID=3555 RepID=UPI00203762C0|nr:auxin-responsive protein SAUR76 [Beta vulgaris subsp. vulgaris]